MRFAFLTLVGGNLIVLLQIAAMYLALSQSDFVEYRVIINIANYLGILMCVGMDISTPNSIKKGVSESHQLGGSLIVIVLVAIVSAVVMYLFNNKGLGNQILLGILVGTTIAYFNVINNISRSRGSIDSYFLRENLTQRAVRTILIISLLYVTSTIYYWAILLFIGYLAYGLFIQKGLKVGISLSVIDTIKGVKSGIRYFFVVLLFIGLTRIPYYSSLGVYENIRIVTIDFVLLAYLFLLIPFLNSFKIVEVESDFNIKSYINYAKNHLSEKRSQQRIISIGLVIVIFAFDWLFPKVTQDIMFVSGFISLGMVIITSGQHYLGLLQWHSKSRYLIYAVFFIISGIISINMILITFDVYYYSEWLFLLSALLYFLVGLFFWHKVPGVDESSFIDSRWLVEGVLISLSLFALGA
ncbi:MAG: hypothetical protein ISR69_07035 [Gammaproteobacteria bacterium]|nr:hypothetical protein [Gammaproteobacteria bacterium]